MGRSGPSGQNAEAPARSVSLGEPAGQVVSHCPLKAIDDAEHFGTRDLRGFGCEGMTVRDGGVIADGYDPELDELRTLDRDAGEGLAAFE